MDEIARYNSARWKALAQSDALFARPALDLDAQTAREMVDPEGLLGDLRGSRVLCLAAGGGKQSAAFALLGARVTVVDLSDEVLQRDRDVAEHYKVSIVVRQGDMRDLSQLDRQSFDLVWQPYALNFVPDVQQVFQQVAAVLRPGGRYYVQCANPFTVGLGPQDWNGHGYSLRHPYQDGAVIETEDADWVYDRSAQTESAIEPPREYRHSLSTLLNGLIEQDFVLTHMSDSRDMSADPDAEPGSWDHFVWFAPPWISFWTVFRPESVAE